MNILSINIRLVSLAAIVLLAAGCDEVQTNEDADQLVKSVNVEVEEIKPENFSSYLRLVGTVVTSEDVQVSAEISGRIEKHIKKEGETVRRGDVIAKIDDRKLQQESRRLQALTRQSEENYLRLKQLYQEENIGSEIDFLNARYTFQQNQAALESIHVDIENTEITSPVSGIVEELMYEEGEMVTAGMPVARIIGSDHIKVIFGVPARYAAVVDLGDEAEVWFDHNPDQKYRLPITFVGRSINRQDRTFKVEALFQNPGNQIKVDMLANVRLKTESLADQIVLSEEFIHKKNGRNVAFIAGEDQEGNPVAVERSLDLGPSFGNHVVVNRGLEFGEKLITVGSSYLLDQTRIVIVNQDSGFTASDF
ncbi:MAG: efflux RND transporter periplasmic adaptor subunit [Balneolaceae bacterium]